MREHLVRLRVISAIVLSCLVSPAFVGYAAAAACHEDAMPCCRQADAVASVKPACCNIQQAPATHDRTPMTASSSDRSSWSVAPAAPAAMPVIAADDVLASAASRAPASRGIPLYLAFSALRR